MSAATPCRPTIFPELPSARSGCRGLALPTIESILLSQNVAYLACGRAAGVDGQSIAEFEEDLIGNLYKQLPVRKTRGSPGVLVGGAGTWCCYALLSSES
jgi:hypothetical protein